MTTRRNTPKDSNLHIRRHENLKCHLDIVTIKINPLGLTKPNNGILEYQRPNWKTKIIIKCGLRIKCIKSIHDGISQIIKLYVCTSKTIEMIKIKCEILTSSYKVQFYFNFVPYFSHITTTLREAQMKLSSCPKSYRIKEHYTTQYIGLGLIKIIIINILQHDKL
jgi:hypothetical protein